jgi:predicted TIM-barrel fold metal-dependent hydrolase
MAALTSEALREIRVIDTDTHIMEPADLWTSRISVKKWGDLVPHVKPDPVTGEEFWYFGDEKVWGAGRSAMAGWKEFPPSHPRGFHEVPANTIDPAERLHLMDDYGIWAQVLYPNVAGFGAGRYLGIREPELMLQCVQAYNDYLAEWGKYAPGRYIPVMALPFWDLDASIQEMERSAANGHRGIIFGSELEMYGVEPLLSPHWDRLWAAAQDAELPINFHIASGDLSNTYDPAEYMGASTAYAAIPVGFFLGNARTVTQLIAGGICHRFPRLDFVSVESGVGWIPFVLESMDWQWQNCDVRSEHTEYDLLPSEYFKRQIYGCFWFEKKTVRAVIDQIGDDNLFYETDFPHPTSMSPGPASRAQRPDDFIIETMSDLEPSTQRKILRNNAARVYHLGGVRPAPVPLTRDELRP